MTVVVEPNQREAPHEAGATDADLLARFASSRDEVAFRALIHRHGPMVLAVCRRVLGNPHDAEDAFQATFLLLARKAGQISQPQLLSAWLYGVAHRTALKARGQAARRQQAEQHARPPEAAAALGLAWREVQQALDEEVLRLDESLRAPLVLCYLEGRTHQEAARELGQPVGSISGLLRRALDRLRSQLTLRGVSLCTGLPGLLLLLRVHELIADRLVDLVARAAVLGPTAGPVIALLRLMQLELAPRRGWRWVLGLVLAIALLSGLALGAAALSPLLGGPREASPAGSDATGHCGKPCSQ